MKIAVLSSHTESLFWFRLDMMKAFKEAGHIVVAVGSEPESIWTEKFEEHGIQYSQISVKRNGINFLEDFKTFRELNQFLKKEQPDKVFSYQAKTIVYGSLAARLNKISDIYVLIAGLGSVFRGSGLKNLIIKKIMSLEYWIAFKFSKKVFFQNKDDLNEFIAMKLVSKDKTILINGSGVNLEKFKPTPLPEQTAFLFIGRLIKDKGIVEYLEACKQIKKKYPGIRCLLVGPYDSNPTALKPEDLKPYVDSKIVEYFGQQDDVRPFITECSVYVLPSYHEGMPKTVLEAMAMGRPVITTDAPGCRETVVDGENGYLVPVKNFERLVEKMNSFILDSEKIQFMGSNSIKVAQEKFDVAIVNKTISCAIEV